MATIRIFAESLSINNIAQLIADHPPKEGETRDPLQPGATLVLGAHQCTIAALPGDYNYVIVADQLSLSPDAFVIVQGTRIPYLTVAGTPANPSPSITVLAIEMDGAFNLESRPMPGRPGIDGEKGHDREGPQDHAGNGENGTDGTPGSDGGAAIIHYCSYRNATQPPDATAPGGKGGPGGLGGKKGQGGGTPKAIDGTDGAKGSDGKDGKRESIQVPVLELWDAMDPESELAWALFRGASITYWNRIEPRSRAQDIRAGLEARLSDPLWLLARQWQIGEFEGRDAGSPVAVDVTTTTRAFDRYAQGTAAGQKYDRSTPLEVLVEREPVRPARAVDDLRQAAEAGLHFIRLLDAAQLAVPRVRGPYMAQYSLPALTSESGGFGNLLAARVIDGIALHEDLKGVTDKLPPKPAFSDADRALLLPVVKTWLAWYGALFSEPAHEPAWSLDRMEYSFAIGAAGDTGSFVASEYDGGTADWHTFSKAGTTLTGGSVQPSTTKRRALPAPVTFKGMPARRYWELEDGSVDIGAMAAAPEDLGRLLLREFALIYATDWFQIPLRVPVGSVTNIDSFKVSDTFGLTTDVPHYSAADGPDGRWRMFAISATGSSGNASRDNRLLVLPTAMGTLESEAIEDVLLLRDELADLVWGVERSSLGPEGVPIDRALVWKTMAPPVPPPAAAGVPHYRLGSDVPDYWFPFLPVLVPSGANTTSLRFRRGKLPTAKLDPLGTFLSTPGLTLFPEEVPREGVHLERRFRYAKDANGVVYLWIGRQRSTGRGEGRSGLRFDYLET